MEVKYFLLAKIQEITVGSPTTLYAALTILAKCSTLLLSLAAQQVSFVVTTTITMLPLNTRAHPTDLRHYDDYLGNAGHTVIESRQRGAELITIHSDSTWDSYQIPLDSITYWYSDIMCQYQYGIGLLSYSVWFVDCSAKSSGTSVYTFFAFNFSR